MISDEEIDAVFAQEGSSTHYDFARAVYQLGRQQQRESDAALCKILINSISDIVVLGEDRREGGVNALNSAAEAIHNNKEN